MIPPAAQYGCAHYPCDARAVVVYQGAKHPSIYGSCVSHLAWASDSSRCVLEGARIIHFTNRQIA